MNKILLVVVLFASSLLSGCYSITDPNDEIFDTIGDVAYVRSFTAAAATVAPGGTLDLTLKSFSMNSAQKEIKIYEKVGTAAYSLKSTIPFAATFSETERLWIQTIKYVAPNTASASVSLQVGVITENGLESKNLRTISIKTTK